MVDYYVNILELRNYKHDTIRRIAQHLNHFLRWIENKNVSDIADSDINNYLITLKNSGLKEKTLSNRLSSIKCFMEFLCLQGYIDFNPILAIKRISIPETIPIYLPDNEIKLLIQLAYKENISTEVITALNTGLRMNELRQLKWPDIDFTNKQIIVQGENAKGKRPRTVPLNKKAYKALEQQLLLYNSYTYVFPGGKGGKGNKNIWSNNTMRSYNWWLRYSLDPIRDKIPTIANLPKGSTCRGWHIFRHTFATKLARAGVDLMKIKTWMGHRSINTTMRYIHLKNQYDEDIELI